MDNKEEAERRRGDQDEMRELVVKIRRKKMMRRK
jgi:hypothetical protein